MSTWNPDTGAGRINNGDFSNKRIDEITALVESETDTEKRDALILEAYKIVHDNVYYVPLHHQNVTWAVRKGVSIEQRPDDQFDYRTVRIED
jgi:peptide/nickel transport system substrate-binding protein